MMQSHKTARRLANRVTAALMAFLLTFSSFPSAALAEAITSDAISTEISAQITEGSDQEAVDNGAADSDEKTSESVQEEESSTDDSMSEDADTNNVVESEVPATSVDTDSGQQADIDNKSEDADVATLSEVEPTTATYTWTSEDYSQMLGVTVSSPSGQELPEPADDGGEATLSVEELDASALEEALAAAYDGEPGYTALLAASVVLADGSAAQLPADAEVKVSYVRMDFANPPLAVPTVFCLSDGALVDLGAAEDNSLGYNAPEMGMVCVSFEATTGQLGSLAFVDASGLTEKKGTETEKICDLAPGTYTADVNLYVPDYQAPIGMNAYMTSTDFPPIQAKTQNGQIVVGEDGSVTAYIYPVQEIFTLQDITSSDEIEVISIERGGSAESYGDHSDRITTIVAKLKNGSGTYKFGSAVQYPTILKEDKTWDMYAVVDFSSATPGGYDPSQGGQEGSYTKTFTDEATGANVTASTSDSSIGALLDSATCSIKHLTSGSDAEACKAVLSSVYRGEPTYDFWSVRLYDQLGNEVEADGSIGYVVTLPLDGSLDQNNTFDLYKIDDSTYESATGSVQSGAMVIRDVSLGTYAIVDATANGVYKYYRATFTNEELGITGELVTSQEAAMTPTLLTDPSVVSISFDAEDTDAGEIVTIFNQEDIRSSSPAYQYDYKELVQSYVASGMSQDAAEKQAESDLYSTWVHGLTGSYHSFTITMPIPEGCDQLVLVRDDGASKTAENIQYSVENGYATFGLFNDNNTKYTRTESIFSELRNGAVNGYDSGTEDAPVAYLLFVKSDNKIVGVPQTLLQNNEYANAQIRGVEEFDSSKIKLVSGDVTGFDAGDYSATLEPINGYTWIDGTTKPITLTWTIEKRTIGVVYREYVKYGETPTFELSFENLAPGDTVDTVENLSTVSVTEEFKNQTFEPGTVYWVSEDDLEATWEDGTRDSRWTGSLNKNYKLKLDRIDPNDLSNLLSMGMSPEEEASVVQGLTYTGEEQVGVVSNSTSGASNHATYTLSGETSATDSGTYTAVATLAKAESGIAGDRFCWSDGTTEPKTITWTINKAQLTVEFKDTTITQGQELGTGSLEITGFVNGETLLSVQQSDETFQMPTVSNADVNTLGSRVVYPSGGVAKNYTFIPKPGTLTVKTAAVGTLEPGTYSITANIYMPGENNPILTNTDVYANNPNNPFGIIDENDASTVNGELAPTTGLTKNATLVVGEDGTKTLILPIQNPVFTTQAIGTCTELPDVWVERVSATGTYPSGYASENGKYGAYSDRIHKLGVTLTDTQVSGTKVYEFTGSKLYAVPLDLEFAPSGTSLKLVVNYDELTKISDSTTNPFPNSSSTDTGKEDGKKEENTDKNQNQNQNTGDQNQNSGNSSNTTDQNQSGSTTVNGHLKAGTYTVTANIWVSRASSGLPLSPHITSGIFPPKDPVTNNATLVVDDSGRCILYLPIQIQSKVMTVQSVNGLNVIGTSGGGALTQVVIDLGVLENPGSSIVRSCSVSITMGSLASTISGITGSHTWDATFELNLSGLPSSGGETIPAGYLDKLTNATSDVAGVTTEDAAAAALEALDEAEAAEGDGEKNGPVSKLTNGDGKEKDGGAAVEEAVEEALEANPIALVIGLLLVGALLGAGAFWLILLAKRRKKDDEEKAAQAGEGAGPKDPTA